MVTKNNEEDFEMNASKIKDLLEGLVGGDKFKNCIAIDGVWGIGKTYQIDRFIENHKKDKNTKIIYQSLAGKKTIEEIHASLYGKIYPGVKPIKVIASVISLSTNQLFDKVGVSANIGSIASEAIQALEKKPEENKNVRKRKEKICLIIFDDLERAGSNLEFDLFFGYLNQLTRSGFKVCIICNSSEMKKKIEDFSKLKEKAFDREYKVDEFDEEAMNSFLEENGITFAVNEDTINLFDNNLRLAKKALSFYRDVEKHLSSLNSGEYHVPKEEILLRYCSLLLRWLTGAAKTEIYSERLNDVDRNLIILGIIEEHFEKDKDIRAIQCAIYQDIDESNSIEQDIAISRSRSEFISSLAMVYFHEDYSPLYNFLRLKAKESPFEEKDIFFKSQEGKIEHIKKALRHLENNRGTFSEKDARLLVSIFRYKHLFPVDFDEDRFAKAVVRTIDDDKMLEAMLQPNNSESIINFAKKIEVEFKETKREKILSEIKETIKNKSTYEIYLCLRKVIDTLNNDEKTQKIIVDDFLNNELYLPKLDGDLIETDWDKAKDIVWFLGFLDKEKECMPYLTKKRDGSSNETLKERFGLLINIYRQQIKWYQSMGKAGMAHRQTYPSNHHQETSI